MDFISSAVNNLTNEFEEPLLQKDARLTKEQLYQFFDQAEKMMTSEETKNKLRVLCKEGQEAGDAVTEMQKTVLIQLGIDGDFGIQYMAQVTADYQSDQQLMARFLSFVQSESMLLDEVENDPETIAEVQLLNQRVHELQLGMLKPLQQSGAAKSQIAALQFKLQQRRQQLLVQWCQDAEHPSDMELTVPMQRDFLRFAVEVLEKEGAGCSGAGSSSQATRCTPEQAPSTQEMD